MIMEKQIVWSNKDEVEKIRKSYTTFEKAFNEAIDDVEREFSIKLKQGDIELFFENRKCLTPFRQSLANYLWNYGTSRIGTSQEQIEEKIKTAMSPFVRATCSIYWTDPRMVEISDCRLKVKWNDLDAYLEEQFSVSLNTETRQRIWGLAQEACKILNELEKAAVENSNTEWFKVHATAAHLDGGRAIIHFANGEYQCCGDEIANIK